MKRDLRIHKAFGPASRSAEDVQYNGTSTVTDAAGIPLKDAQTVCMHINTGSTAATSVAYQLMASILATPTGAGDLSAITGALVTTTGDSDNTQSVATVRIDRQALPAAMQKDPLYLYVKRTQVGASAVLDSVQLVFVDHKELPELVNAGTAATVEVL